MKPPRALILRGDTSMYYRVQDVASDFNTNVQAVRQWVKDRPDLWAQRRYAPAPHGGYELYLPFDVVTAYQQGTRFPRVPSVPAGWMTSTEAMRALGVSRRGLDLIADRGELSGVRVGQRHYYDPERVRHAALRRKDARRTPSWVPVQALTGDVQTPALIGRAKRRGLRTRTYPRPDGGLMSCVHVEDIPALMSKEAVR